MFDFDKLRVSLLMHICNILLIVYLMGKGLPEKWNWILKFNHPCEDVRIMHFLGGRWKGTVEFKALETELLKQPETANA